MKRSLYTSKITGGLLRKIDQQIEKVGLAGTLRRVFKDTNTKIEITKEDRSVNNALKKGPTIVICNHPAEAEVLVLLANVMRQKNFWLVAQHNFLKILPSIDKYIIPVYIAHRITEGDNNLKFRILRKIHTADQFSKEEAHEKNVNSILEAAEKIDNGGLVIIFPMAADIDGHFLPGVGHMVKNLKNRRSVNLVMAHASGTSTLDYLRIIPLLGRFMPKVELKFAKPVKLDRYQGDDARRIAREMEADYYTWARKFEKRVLPIGNLAKAE